VLGRYSNYILHLSLYKWYIF